MQVTLEDAHTFIIEYLQNPSRYLDPNIQYPNWGYEFLLSNIVKIYIKKRRAMAWEGPISPKDRDNLITRHYPLFMEAAWNLCRMGVLRPGTAGLGSEGTNEGRDGGGFCVTAFGKAWIAESDTKTRIPSDPFHLTQLLEQFQTLFGPTYFKRAREAVRCFQANVCLACCAMCGAAAESILLQLAFAIEDKETVLKRYLSASGRRRTEDLIFSQTPKHIRDRYSKYTDLINYWRDESGHGNQSDIDVHHAYEALTTLVMFAHFVKDHWNELTTKEAKETA